MVETGAMPFSRNIFASFEILSKPRLLGSIRENKHRTIIVTKSEIRAVFYAVANSANQGSRDGDGGGPRTVKDDGRKIFIDSVRFKDGFGRRTGKIS